MPFMGGMEATELIREHEMKYGLNAIPIIALTAHASKSNYLYRGGSWLDADYI